ncbi:MAG: methionine transport ATP-binding protein [Pseudomonadota bacterium]|jgi:D-methionine transport system ATP-binding protein
MIVLENVSKTFAPTSPNGRAIPALRNISLRVLEGEIFGIIGKSGAGKSTLVRCMNALERPSSGKVLIDRENVTLLPAKLLRVARRQIGMIFQHFHLMASRTVYDNIALPLEFMGYPKHEIEARVIPLLELVGLTDKMLAYPNQLSGGQKQRVAIARALANQPKVLLCDEATSALDPKTTHAILDLLKHINQTLGLTVILITHEMDVIKSICDRVAVLHQGTIVEESSVLELFSRPQSDVAKELIKVNTRSEMPNALRRKMVPMPSEQCHYVLRLSFRGQAAQEPLMARVIQRFDLTINIIQAHLETIREEMIGIMIIEMVSEGEDTIPPAIQFLESQGIHIEVLGYVPRTA